ncbi:unnamed protein product [Caretta caretta]
MPLKVKKMEEGRIRHFKSWMMTDQAAHLTTEIYFADALCIEVLSLQHVMNVVIKIINSIRAKPLQHRLFKALLEDVDDKQSDLILHTEVRWLSKNIVLACFLSLIEEIKEFLKSTNQNFEQLEDSSWLMDFVFLADITDKLNILNLELQGKETCGSNDRFCKIIQSKTDLVDVTYEDEVSRTFPKYEENEVTEMATSIASLIQVRTEDVELEILDLQHDIV